MDATNIWLAIAVMASVTYAIRMLPLVILKREITEPHVRAFLHYVPYATLTAMTIPAAILDAPTLLAGLVGVSVAVLLALWRVSLVLVAAIASLAVWLVEVLL
ncbi:MAG: AzlD domain-containing protein [Kiritimatiellae bacterium]|nr:AzlD domain-containing protein [Kiritimatiellia bacterium]MBR4945883.1 AzlD domain-containing protein [Kiritimatiellia bacterium]MBR5588024.1 AzlD domain-containing protein [Kiritimatiellia bacterium]